MVLLKRKQYYHYKNSKSVDYEKFKTYLVEKDKLNKETTDFYKRDTWRYMEIHGDTWRYMEIHGDTWRKMKFRQYSYGKKSIDTFLNKIKETLEKIS